MNYTFPENTLFIGNGFSRAIFKDMPAWSDLFEGVNSPIQDYTILYETYLLEEKRRGRAEKEVKEELVKKIKTTFSGKSIRDSIYDLNQFGQYLIRSNIKNILTTNYDDGIEFILCELCEYQEQKPKDKNDETVYSIRRYKSFINHRIGHEIKLWKIHGDVKKTQSIMLGFDQYCESLSKLSEYIKGTYTFSKNGEDVKCKSMEEKCRNQEFDCISWAELFFCTNIYIVGFGLSSSEIDIWWLLNKRARLMIDLPQINNQITYLYDEKYESPFQALRDQELKEIKPLFVKLDAFQVSYIPIKSDANYINNIFNNYAVTEGSNSLDKLED